MFKIGEIQELVSVKRVDFGIYFADEEDTENKVLLPGKEVPSDFEIGNKMTLFLYKDSKDRLIATTRIPKVTVGGLSVLTVSSVTRIGAFLDWGLEKDLFLPFKEQTGRVEQGDEVLVSAYVDKSERLCATMKVYHKLGTDSDYDKDDWVNARIYEISDRFGAFAAVDDKYSGLIPKKEVTRELRVGDVLECRVTAVLEDGKLNLSVRDKAYMTINKDADYIVYLIKQYDGVLPFNDKATPETIKRECNMSKNQFKRAVGHLLKNGDIEIGEKVIYLRK